LAEFLLWRKDYEGAQASAQKALALSASNRRARLDYAAAQMELGKNITEALKSLQILAAGPLTDNDPSFEEIHYWIGRACLAQNQKAEARQAFQASLGFDPEYARSKRALSQIK
jgi:predicted Zn-dependent protease